MENASKALLMAGGVLIGVLILVLVIFFWTKMSGFVANGSAQDKEKQISEFNMQFESYNRGSTEKKEGSSITQKDVPVYGSDIITIANKIETYNRGGNDELFQQAFNSKVQYEPIKLNLKLGSLKSSNSLFSTVGASGTINDIVGNKNFFGDTRNNYKIHKYGNYIWKGLNE